jgi:hypothetical protein
MATLQERRLGYHSRAGLEPGTSGFSTLRINHYAARGIQRIYPENRIKIPQGLIILGHGRSCCYRARIMPGCRDEMCWLLTLLFNLKSPR